jgi:ArsR family transcriptional regulator, arsenate/arsenite/antimonite-responsive transcriptional repressor
LVAPGFDIGQYRPVSKSCSGPVEGCEFAPLVREPLSGEAAAEWAVRLKALADPARLRLMSLIASHDGGEACVCDVSVGIELTQPTISHHLKVLRTAGLLTAERRGSWVYYRVIPDALQQLSQLLGPDSLAAAGSR